MSYCSIVTFQDGLPSDEAEFPNSWGGASRIWDALFEKYLKNPDIPYDMWFRAAEDGTLWKLADSEELSDCERAVLASTFDYAIITNENFARFAQHLREFVGMYPVPDKVDHLADWAAFIEDCNADVVGFHATSVGQNLWYKWDDEKDESVPYNLNDGQDHFDVYHQIGCSEETNA
jgi:hypothetical protein